MENKEAMIQEILEMFTRDGRVRERKLFDYFTEQQLCKAEDRDYPIEVVDAAVAEVMAKAAA